MMLSGSSSSGGVGVGVGFRRGGGGGSPRVGALRSEGRVVCGVGVGVAVEAGRAGTGVGLGTGVWAGVWVVRGRSWPPAKTLEPKIRVETIKPQIARIPVRLTFCSLNNGKLLYIPRGLGQTNTATSTHRSRDAGDPILRCRRPETGAGAVGRCTTDVLPAPANCSCSVFPTSAGSSRGVIAFL